MYSNLYFRQDLYHKVRTILRYRTKKNRTISAETSFIRQEFATQLFEYILWEFEKALIFPFLMALAIFLSNSVQLSKDIDLMLDWTNVRYVIPLYDFLDYRFQPFAAGRDIFLA